MRQTLLSILLGLAAIYLPPALSWALWFYLAPRD